MLTDMLYYCHVQFNTGVQVDEIRITITVKGDEQAGKVLDVLGEGEAEGKLDFAFEVRTDRVEFDPFESFNKSFNPA